MLTSKQRADLRAQANLLETTLMVGKDGVSEAVIAEAENLLTARELVKGKVLETALLSPREVSDAICQATGADGVAVIGTKFVKVFMLSFIISMLPMPDRTIMTPSWLAANRMA